MRSCKITRCFFHKIKKTINYSTRVMLTEQQWIELSANRNGVPRDFLRNNTCSIGTYLVIRIWLYRTWQIDNSSRKGETYKILMHTTGRDCNCRRTYNLAHLCIGPLRWNQFFRTRARSSARRKSNILAICHMAAAKYPKGLLDIRLYKRFHVFNLISSWNTRQN